jgi:rod shape-determining protein MreD
MSASRSVSPTIAALLLALVAVAQATVMPYAALGQARPLLPVMVVVTWGLLQGGAAAAWWAIGGGLMLDLLSPAPAGFYVLPLLGVATLAGLFRGRLFQAHLILPAAVVAIGTLSFGLMQRSMIDLAGGRVVWDVPSLAEEIVPAVVLNWIWLPLIYFPLRVLARRIGEPAIDWER